jgi:hypothetical protein
MQTKSIESPDGAVYVVGPEPSTLTSPSQPEPPPCCACAIGTGPLPVATWMTTAAAKANATIPRFSAHFRFIALFPSQKNSERSPTSDDSHRGHVNCR